MSGITKTIVPEEFCVYSVKPVGCEEDITMFAQFMPNADPEEEDGSDSHVWALFGDEECYPQEYFQILDIQVHVDQMLESKTDDLAAYGYFGLVTGFDTAEELQNYTDKFRGGERSVATTASLIGWNTAIKALHRNGLLRPIPKTVTTSEEGLEENA